MYGIISNVKASLRNLLIRTKGSGELCRRDNVCVTFITSAVTAMCIVDRYENKGCDFNKNSHNLCERISGVAGDISSLTP
jgi:hypothetical protein